MCICTYVYTFMRIYVRMYINRYVCIYICNYVCDVCIHDKVCLYTYIIYVCVSIHITHIFVVYIYIHFSVWAYYTLWGVYRVLERLGTPGLLACGWPVPFGPKRCRSRPRLLAQMKGSKYQYKSYLVDIWAPEIWTTPALGPFGQGRSNRILHVVWYAFWLSSVSVRMNYQDPTTTRIHQALSPWLQSGDTALGIGTAVLALGGPSLTFASQSARVSGFQMGSL